jgi:hypothetical protein
MSNPGHGGFNRSNPILDRAFAAGAWLCAGVVAMTGIFIARIDSSSAVSTTSTSTTNGTTSDPGGSTSVLPGNGGQVAPAPQNQAPQGRTHGS